MSKNKKWKRKAKRIKGDCTRWENLRFGCRICIHDYNYNCDYIIANTLQEPKYVDIRTLERICKYEK